MQTVELNREKVPAAHVAHAVLPFPRYEPASHAKMKQTLEPAAAPYPLTHGTQVLLLTAAE